MTRTLHRGLVLLILLALLLPALPRPAAAYDNGGRFLDWSGTGTPFRTFGGGATIQIHTGRFQPLVECPNGGIKDTIPSFTDIYIVPSGSVAPGGKLKDTSNTGEPNTVQGSGQGLFLGETIGFTAPAGAVGAGRYAVVYDECQNGKFDAGEDALFDPAFEVVLTTGVTSLPGSFAAVKLDAHQQARQWNLVHLYLSVLFAIEEINGWNSIAKGLFDRSGSIQALEVFFELLNKAFE